MPFFSKDLLNKEQIVSIYTDYNLFLFSDINKRLRSVFDSYNFVIFSIFSGSGFSLFRLYWVHGYRYIDCRFSEVINRIRYTKIAITENL